MPRIARAIAVGCPHHITQRGNYRQTVFAGAEDYARYLEVLVRCAPQNDLEIWAYCAGRVPLVERKEAHHGGARPGLVGPVLSVGDRAGLTAISGDGPGCRGGKDPPESDAHRPPVRAGRVRQENGYGSRSPPPPPTSGAAPPSGVWGARDPRKIGRKIGSCHYFR